MMNSRRLPLSLLLLISSVYYAAGELETVPENLVGIAGTTVTLRCTAAATPTARVMWTEFATSSTGLILSDNKGIVPSHPNSARYSITGGALDYNLEIRNVSLADGGRYLCQDINGVPPAVNRGTAELVIINDNPVCTGLQTITGVLIEERFYTKECDVKYSGNISPNMTWTGPGTYNVDNSVTVSEAWTRVSFTADREIEGGQFVMTTRFILPDNIPADGATNDPSYVYTFYGSILIINWGPQNMEITPRKPTYTAGDVLTCTADAKPTPTFRWTNLRTLDVENPGATFTVTEELEGTEQTMRCNANSLIEGSLYTQDAFVNVSYPAPTTPTIPPSTTPTTPPPADGPCLDLTGQWTSTNPNALLCIEMDTKGNLVTLIRNGTDEFFVIGHGKTVYNDYKHVGFSGIWPPGSEFGVGGFTGECHRCHGNEVLLMSGLARNKEHSTECGTSAGTRLTNLYVFTRFGPPCRNPPGKVFRPTEQHIKLMDIRPENILS